MAICGFRLAAFVVSVQMLLKCSDTTLTPFDDHHRIHMGYPLQLLYTHTLMMALTHYWRYAQPQRCSAPHGGGTRVDTDRVRVSVAVDASVINVRLSLDLRVCGGKVGAHVIWK